MTRISSYFCSILSPTHFFISSFERHSSIPIIGFAWFRNSGIQENARKLPESIYSFRAKSGMETQTRRHFQKVASASKTREWNAKLWKGGADGKGSAYFKLNNLSEDDI